MTKTSKAADKAQNLGFMRRMIRKIQQRPFLYVQALIWITIAVLVGVWWFQSMLGAVYGALSSGATMFYSYARRSVVCRPEAGNLAGAPFEGPSEPVISMLTSGRNRLCYGES